MGQEYVYEDPGRNVYADLSSCRVWVYSVRADVMKEGAGPAFLRHDIRTMNPVICAVLWRLLPNWQDKGPVLEVLFLATSPEMWERGWAAELEEELERVATSMGCSAIAVAAVPAQGMNLWTVRCGFEIVVPLRTGACPDGGVDEEHPLGEPVNGLGDFLLRHMLLFTDTPLVAKVLRNRGG